MDRSCLCTQMSILRGNTLKFNLNNQNNRNKSRCNQWQFLIVVFPLWWFQIEKLDARGIQLAALFMSGVDTALFANDACGQPVPWEHCCPWIYFDGKLFQSKLIKAGRERVSLVELCDGQVPLCRAAAKGHLWSTVGMNGQRVERNRDIGEGGSRSRGMCDINLTGSRIIPKAQSLICPCYKTIRWKVFFMNTKFSYCFLIWVFPSHGIGLSCNS